MEMFLMAAVMSLLAVAVSAVSFAAATRDARSGAATPAKRPALEPQRFFVSAADAVSAVESTKAPETVPVEALLLQIEQHIRLEQPRWRPRPRKPKPKAPASPPDVVDVPNASETEPIA